MDVRTWRPGHRISKSAVQLTYTSAGGDALRKKYAVGGGAELPNLASLLWSETMRGSLVFKLWANWASSRDCRVLAKRIEIFIFILFLGERGSRSGTWKNA